MPLVSFLPPENIRKLGFLMFSEGVERDQWRDQWNESGLMHSLLQVTLLSCSLMAIS